MPANSSQCTPESNFRRTPLQAPTLPRSCPKAQMLLKCCPRVAQGAELWPKFGQCWPMSRLCGAKFGQARTDTVLHLAGFGQTWPKQSNAGQAGESSGKHWPKAESCQACLWPRQTQARLTEQEWPATPRRGTEEGDAKRPEVGRGALEIHRTPGKRPERTWRAHCCIKSGGPISTVARAPPMHRARPHANGCTSERLLPINQAALQAAHFRPSHPPEPGEAPSLSHAECVRGPVFHRHADKCHHDLRHGGIEEMAENGRSRLALQRRNGCPRRTGALKRLVRNGRRYDGHAVPHKNTERQQRTAEHARVGASKTPAWVWVCMCWISARLRICVYGVAPAPARWEGSSYCVLGQIWLSAQQVAVALEQISEVETPPPK